MKTENPFNTLEGKNWIKSMLRMGPGTVEFTKADGTTRVMNCTLQEDKVVLYEKKTDRVKVPSDETLAVFDLDKQEWRSFRYDKITKFSFSI